MPRWSRPFSACRNAGAESRRAARDCSPSLLFRWTPGSHVWIRPMRTGRLVADRRRPRRGSTTVRTRNLRFCRLPARPARGTFDRSGVSRFRDAHPHISHRRRRAPGRTRPLEQLAYLVAGRPRDPAASTWLPACCDQAPERHDAWGAACEQRSYLTGAFGDRSSSTSVSKRSKSFTSA